MPSSTISVVYITMSERACKLWELILDSFGPHPNELVTLS